MSGPPSVGEPRTFMAELPLAGVTAAMTLMSRRTRALADFWAALPAAREPADLAALQLNYCRQMADDYAQAFAESVAPLSHPALQPATPPAEAKPSQEPALAA